MCVSDEGINFEISVWNCRASLLAFREDDGGREYYDIEIEDKELKKKIDKEVVESVYDVGGAINISGLYPLNNKLEMLLEEGLKTGKIKLKASK